ncbi:unnamed protein product, partial [Polarella glacialis]
PSELEPSAHSCAARFHPSTGTREGCVDPQPEMDPESGTLPLSGDNHQGSGRAAEDSPNVMQQVIQALLSRLRTLMDTLAPGGRAVGVENRFFYDEVEKVWKIEGGETDKERAEMEAIRFHTSRGLSYGLAPATTACDATRGAWGGEGLPAPPPMGGSVTRSIHGPSVGVDAMAALAHPVYAPQGTATGSHAAAPPPGPAPSTRQAAPPAGFVPQARTSPFGQAPAAAPSPAPLSSPFAATFGAGQATALSSPFAAVQASVVAAPSQFQPVSH